MPLSWQDALKLTGERARKPDPNPKPEITLREVQLQQLAKAGTPAYRTLMDASTIKAPAVPLTLEDPKPWTEVAQSWVEKTGDRSILDVLKDNELHRSARKRAIKEANGYLRLHPDLSEGAAKQIIASAYLWQMKQMAPVSKAEATQYRTASYELLVNEGVRLTNESEHPLGKEEVTRRRNIAAQLRQLDPAQRQFTIEVLEGQVDKDSLEEKDFSKQWFMASPETSLAPKNPVKVAMKAIARFRELYGYGTSSEMMHHGAKVAGGMRRRLSLAKIGVDPEVNGNLTEANVVLADPSKSEGFGLVATFAAPFAAEELAKGAASARDVARYASTDPLSTPLPIVKQILKAQYLTHDPTRARLGQQLSRVTPEQKAAMGSAGNMLIGLFSRLEDVRQSFLRGVEQVGTGPRQRELAQKLLVDLRPGDKTKSAIDAADVEGFYSALRVMFTDVFVPNDISGKARTDLAADKASSELPLLVFHEQLRDRIGMDRIVQEGLPQVGWMKDFEDRSTRLQQWTKGKPVPGYTAANAYDDLRYGVFAMIGSAVAQFTGEVAEHPGNIAVAMAAEAGEELTIGNIVRKGGQFLTEVRRKARIRKNLQRAGGVAPLLARRAQAMTQEIRLRGAEKGFTKRKMRMLEEMEAQSDILVEEAQHIRDDGTARAYLRSPSPSLDRFARSMAGLWDELKESDEALISSMESFIDTSREGSITAAKRWWGRLKGTMPSLATERLNKMAAVLTNEDLGRAPQSVLKRQVPGDTVVQARAEAAADISQGKVPDSIRGSMDQVIDSGGDVQHIPGAVAQWEKLNRLSNITDTLQREPAGPLSRALQKERNDLIKTLAAEPLVDTIDQAGLLLLDNMEQMGRGGALEAVGRIAHKVSGGRLFPDRASLHAVKTAARRILDATGGDTMEFLGQVMMDRVRKRRVDQLYRYADAKLRSRISQHESNILIAEQGHEVSVENEKALRSIARQRQALQVEWRDALTADVRDPYKFNRTLLRNYVTDHEINDLIMQHPSVWGEVDTAAPTGTLSPEAERRIQGLTKHRTRSEDQARALANVFVEKLKKVDLKELGETHPLLVGSFADELYRSDTSSELFHRLVAKRETMRRLAERFHKWKMGQTARGGGEVIDPVDAKATAYDTLNKMANDPELSFSAEDAAYMVQSLESMPDQFWQRGPTFLFRTTDEGKKTLGKDVLGWYSANRDLINAVGSAGANPETLHHEIGHFLLTSALPRKLVNVLADEWGRLPHLDLPDKKKFTRMVKAMTDPDARKATKATRILMGKLDTGKMAEFRPYWDNFTEWFARAYSRQERARIATAPSTPRHMREVAHEINNITTSYDLAEPVNQVVAWAMEEFRRGEFASLPVNAQTRRIQNLARHYGDGLAGARESLIESINKEAGHRMTPEMKLVLRGPLGLSEKEMLGLSDHVNDVMNTLNDVIDSTSAKAGYAPEKFEWNPWQEIDAANDNIHKVKVRSSADEAKRHAEQANRLLDWKLPGGTKNMLDELDSLAQMFRATKASDTGVDLMTVSGLPFWDRVRAIKSMAKDTELRIAVESDHMERLARVLHFMPEDQRIIIQKAMELDTTDLAKLGDRIPALKQHIADVNAKYGAATEANLTRYLKEESATQARLLETAHEQGFIPDELYTQLRESGYTPHLYGMFERPKFIDSKQARGVQAHVGRGSQPVDGDVTNGLDGNEIRFARDLAQWRVRVEAGDGKLFDELFPSREEANNYIQKMWGDEALNGLTEDGPNFAFRSSLGNRGVLARPIGDDADILDLLTGNVEAGVHPDGTPTGQFTAIEKVSPEARLARFSQLNRDIHTHSFLESLRATGLVLTEEQMEQFDLISAGKKQFGKHAQHWRPLPDDPKRFGNLAGHFVHTRVIKEMNNMHGMYDGLQEMFKGLNKVWDDMGYNDLSNAFLGKLKAVASADTKLGKVVKMTQIVQNHAALASNIVTNFTFHAIAVGPQMFHPRNWGLVRQSFRDVFGPGFRGKLPLPGRTRRRTTLDVPDSTYDEAVREGIIGGGLFDRFRNPYLREGLARLAKLMDVDAMEARHARLQKLLAQAQERTANKQRISRIKLELNTLEETMQIAQRGNTKKFMEWGLGTIGWMEKNSMGLPASKVAEGMKRFYGNIDDFFKLTTYRIARKTMPQKKAAWTVKAFMQDYPNVTPIVGALSRTPLIGGLVPSFTHEMARITKNAVKYRGLRFLAMAGGVQAFNSLSAAISGVSEERVGAIEDASGVQDPLEKLIKRSTSIRIYDPRTRDLAWSVDFGDFLFPLLNFAQGYNGLGRMAEGLSDPRTRSVWDSALVGAAKFAGNFVGSRPTTSAVLGALYNQEPVTGQPIWNEDASQRTKWDYTRGFWHLLGKMIIPPQFPLGRHSSDIMSSYDAIPDPRTGRPYKQASLGRNILRALTNLKARGGPAAALSELFGAEDRWVGVNDDDIIQNLMWQATSAQGTSGAGGLPLYGIERERSVMWARVMNEADPATREKLRNQLKAMYREEDAEMIVAGRKYHNSKTRYQEDRWAADKDKLGSLVEQFDNLSVREQTRVLVGMDLAGVDGVTFRDYVEAMITTEEPKYRWETASDPGMLRDAQAEIEAYLHERPTQAEKFKDLKAWLLHTESKALRLEMNREMKEMERLSELGL